MAQSTQDQYDSSFFHHWVRFSYFIETLCFCTDIHPVYIKTAPGEIRERACRNSLAIEKIMQGQVDEPLKWGIIKYIMWCWPFPFVLTKKNGFCRLAINFRDVIKLTEKNIFPLSCPEDVWESKLFSAQWLFHCLLAAGFTCWYPA